MAHIQIANVRSIEKAIIPLTGPLVFLTGPNDGGKTSTARVIAGLVAGTGEIFEGNSKQIAEKVITMGSKGAAAKLYDDNGSRTLRWSMSKGTHRPEEDGDTSTLPKGGVYASALASFLTMAPRERNAAFWRVVPVKPTREQCDAWLKDKGAPALIDDQWTELETIGFDTAAESWGKSATGCAGKWAGIAGEAFGPEKANGWEAEIAEGTDDAPDLDALTKAVDDARMCLEEAEKASKALPAVPSNPSHTLKCPCCDEALMFVSGVLAKYESIPEEDLKAIRLDRASADGKVANARTELSQAERALAGAEAGARDRSKEAEDKTQKAAECFDVWSRLHNLASMAGAKGVRMDLRDQVVEAFNEELGDVARSMGITETAEIVFEKVTGTRDEVVNLQIGGIPYDSLSGNRQWRARAMLQIVIARRTGADLIVMDEVEALEPNNRNKLFGALSKIGMIAVVATYSPSIEKAPDLKAAGLGETYWIDNGQVLPLTAVKGNMAKAA